MTEQIPLFPLNTVLFPGGILPLRIFEVRYLDMISKCLRTDKGFGVSLIRAGSEVGEAAQCFDTGTYARIVDWSQHDDGLLGIEVAGERRFRIIRSTVGANNLLQADIEWLEDEAPRDLPANYQPLRDMFIKLVEQLRHPYQQELEKSTDAVWLGNRLAELLPFELETKQALLELPDSIERMQQLQALVNETDESGLRH